jgi:hypothetical protein
MKVYVDKNDLDFIEDSFLADNTKLISEFHHEESELEYDDCELLDLADYTKQVRKEVIGELMNMLGDRAELIDCGGVAEFMFTTYDLTMCVEEILGEEVKEK